VTRTWRSHRPGLVARNGERFAAIGPGLYAAFEHLKAGEAFALEDLPCILGAPSGAADEGQRRGAVPGFAGPAQRSEGNQLRAFDVTPGKLGVFPYVDPANIHVHLRGV